MNGSLGRGILRAERAGRHYRIVHNPRRGFSSPLVRARVSRSQLNALFQNLYRDEPVLVQEAVGALRVHGRPADIRALVQKDPGGAWRLTGAAGRVAAPGGVTTHTVRGGQAVPYGRLAEEAGGALPGLDVLDAWPSTRHGPWSRRLETAFLNSRWTWRFGKTALPPFSR